MQQKKRGSEEIKELSHLNRQVKAITFDKNQTINGHRGRNTHGSNISYTLLCKKNNNNKIKGWIWGELGGANKQKAEG